MPAYAQLVNFGILKLATEKTLHRPQDLKCLTYVKFDHATSCLPFPFNIRGRVAMPICSGISCCCCCRGTSNLAPQLLFSGLTQNTFSQPISDLASTACLVLFSIGKKVRLIILPPEWSCGDVLQYTAV